MFSIKLPNLENSFEIQESVLKEIISSCDKNGDEQIDFKEFLNSIAQL
jgi:Ca2+-binding EF-hand superfamily protein